MHSTHRAGYTAFPFPKELFRKFITENDGQKHQVKNALKSLLGYFPIKFEALSDGTCIHAHVPVYQVTLVGAFELVQCFLYR